ncbi:hypothetical protein EKG38_12340 [Shewanella canadensis]|uniref:Uncharacterized protein n=1 Tax=Shewanella canadensis TaxID=271096 RepID=A0A431WV42_9GAMM|nr:hypothetical protein EKG38_12340 [Shewanella canadensis]
MRDIRNRVSLYCSLWGKLSVKIADSGAGKGGWRKPMLHCNDADTGLVSGTKVSRLPAGLPLQEN